MTDEDVSGVNDPEELEATGAPASGEIAASTTLGPVHLTVADLDRWVGFYRDAVGLELLGRDDGTASFGAGGRELVVGVEEPGARPAPSATPASTTSPCCCRSEPISPAGSRTPAATGCR